MTLSLRPSRSGRAAAARGRATPIGERCGRRADELGELMRRHVARVADVTRARARDRLDLALAGPRFAVRGDRTLRRGGRARWRRALGGRSRWPSPSPIWPWPRSGASCETGAAAWRRLSPSRLTCALAAEHDDRVTGARARIAGGSGHRGRTADVSPSRAYRECCAPRRLRSNRQIGDESSSPRAPRRARPAILASSASRAAARPRAGPGSAQHLSEPSLPAGTMARGARGRPTSSSLV